MAFYYFFMMYNRLAVLKAPRTAYVGLTSFKADSIILIRFFDYIQFGPTKIFKAQAVFKKRLLSFWESSSNQQFATR